MLTNEEAVKMIFSIEWKIGIEAIRKILPVPFKIDIIQDYWRSDKDIEIYINEENEKITVFSGGYYHSDDCGGHFLDGFEWAEDALAPFFAALPSVSEAANQDLEMLRKAQNDKYWREQNKKSNKAREIYLKYQKEAERR